ncbi:MAG: sugar ABC transporter ATP-binding protein [bacterium]|nr:sugar ABC transporter ATP-binding protein [bacterium]
MEYILQMKGITKKFPGVIALNQVDFAVRQNEIHALVGENGAGKSTLVKIINGVHKMDAGKILFNQSHQNIRNPQHAQSLGISTIYQELHLIPELSVGENILLGREPKRKSGLIDWQTLHRRSQTILHEIEAEIDSHAIVRQLSIAQKQIVMIARAISQQALLLIMDEPTATLTSIEIESLFRLIRNLQSKGKSVIFISHKLDEVFEISERITVLRDGKSVGVLDAQATNKEAIIKLMVGRTLGEEFPLRNDTTIGEAIISIKSVSNEKGIRDISFQVRRGEVVGLFGLVGAGRTEVARAIFGIDKITNGEVFMNDQKVAIRNPKDAIAHGIAFATEDRKSQGLILGMSVKENITLPNMPAITMFSLIKHRAENQLVRAYAKKLNIKTPTIDQETMKLSGGNQQKVVLARWLCAKPKVLILDEPTQGIDVGAKREIYLLINELVKQGLAILMISSELPEILAMSDRVLVMHRGRISGEFLQRDASPEKVLACATGFAGQ